MVSAVDARFHVVALRPDSGKEAARVCGRPAGGVGECRAAGIGLGAIYRGVRGRCPRCGGAKLFRAFLKPVDHCSACRQDWTHQQADDFPAYVSIFLTGHIMAPIIIALVKDTSLSLPALAAIILPLMVGLMILFLQPAKGAIIALQWWFGMHGFTKERRSPEISNHEE